MNDLRLAVRQLWKHAGYTWLAVLTLAIGIAGSTIIFSVFNGLFLRPLPFQNPERLVDLDEVAPRWNLEYTGIAFLDFWAWRAENTTFEKMGLWDETSFNLSFRGQPERIDAAEVTYDFLPTVGIAPILGRGFTAEEDRPGKTQVALIGHSLWQRLWGGRPDVLGTTISLDGVSRTIVGVLPPHLGPLETRQVFVPVGGNEKQDGSWYLQGVGRLKPGVTIEQARQDLTRIHKGKIPNRAVNDITTPRLTPLRDRLFGDYRSVTYVLIAAVAVVWLIACANVAGLTLARGLGRSREISIRMALGATRRSILRQILIESLVLSAGGGLLGLIIGQSILNLLVPLLPDAFPKWIQFGVDGRFLAFSLLTTAGTAIAFGLLPAWQMISRVDLQGALQAASSKSTGSSGQRRSLNALVIVEIALALVLLINAGLLVQAFHHLQHVDPGFRADNVLTYRLSLPDATYPREKATAFFEEHLEALRALPGVRTASAATIVPLSGHSGTFFEVENAPPKGKDEADPVVLRREVLSGYAETMGLTVLEGHFLNAQEMHAPGTNAVVVNESFARLRWPKESAVGKRLRFPGPKNSWLNVVGVVRDDKHYGFDQPVRPGVFLPYTLIPSPELTIAVRGEADPRLLLPSIRALVAKIDPELPIFQIRTMSERVKSSMWLRRSYSWLFGLFASVALGMALAGVYGVISYAVSQRTNEIGIRMALGAQRTDVWRLVLRHGLWLGAAGTVVGLLGAFALSHSMGALLFGVSSTEPLAFIVVPLFLLTVTLFACLVPARRATRVDPMTALRYE